MDLQLSPAQKDGLRRKLIALYMDVFDEEISDFKAGQVLDGFLETLAPAIYNEAVQDMKKFMLNQLEDMEAIYEKR
ncbi:DUF2164 family protein [Pontiellaceae bacterium B12227]|nr:DUF2164 family protein [Pontiellaceae bacterium B12227]